MLRIESVEPGSYADELALRAGDRLLAINDREIGDLIDYYQSIEAAQLEIEVLRTDNELWELSLEKEPEEDFGLELEHPKPLQCGNNCVFCFVHQLPKGLRRTLYIKDEDYRFSYLYGSYITLSNLHETDLERIIQQRLSPLYISVHATDDKIRENLLGCPAPPIMPLLRRLADAGIELHCQIVLCPEFNTGEVLRQSIEDLSELYPQVATLAVVPVGLTKHRQNLPELRKLSQAEAAEALSLIHRCQQEYLSQKGSRFVFAADEFYLQAKADFPPLSDYEDLAQLENGVGLIPQFRQQAEEVLLEADPLELDRVTLVTGSSFADELERFAQRLSLRTGVALQVVPIENRLFGEQVTVTGLLSGTDILLQLQGQGLGAAVLIPEVMLKDGGQLLLDDLTLDDLCERLQVPVLPVESSPWGVLEGLERLAEGPIDIVHC
ncbi:MAG TPA: DUF512 domain-containing protein [Malonomonas sp.]